MDRGSWYSTAAGAAVAALLIMSHLTASPWISAGDWTVIMVLGLFLIATEGLRESGYLQGLVVWIASRPLSARPLFAALVTSSAVLAAIATNDVSLFVVVPLSVGVCRRRKLAPAALVVAEAMAASIGSAAMPWGNPQNIFLFHRFELAPLPFYRLMAPPCLAALAAITFLVVRLAPIEPGPAGDAPHPLPRSPNAGNLPAPPSEAVDSPAPIQHATGLVFAALLLLGALQVLRVLSISASLLALVGICVAVIFRWEILIRTDWTLLLLFAAIFSAVHALERSSEMASVRAAVEGASVIRLYTGSLGLSQIISNVPAALVVAGANHALHASAGAPSERLAALLLGVNVGGLGTPVGSLANLIAARLYRQAGGAGEFNRLYWRMNAAGLLLYFLLGYAALRAASAAAATSASAAPSPAWSSPYSRKATSTS